MAASPPPVFQPDLGQALISAAAYWAEQARLSDSKGFLVAADQVMCFSERFGDKNTAGYYMLHQKCCENMRTVFMSEEHAKNALRDSALSLVMPALGDPRFCEGRPFVTTLAVASQGMLFLLMTPHQARQQLASGGIKLWAPSVSRFADLLTQYLGREEQAGQEDSPTEERPRAVRHGRKVLLLPDPATNMSMLVIHPCIMCRSEQNTQRVLFGSDCPHYVCKKCFMEYVRLWLVGDDPLLECVRCKKEGVDPKRFWLANPETRYCVDPHALISDLEQSSVVMMIALKKDYLALFNIKFSL